MVQEKLKKCVCLSLLLAGAVSVQAQEQETTPQYSAKNPYKLEFNEQGVATVPLEAFVPSGSISVDLENHTISCNSSDEEGALTLYLDDVDFSNVDRITANIKTTEPYVNLFWAGNGGGTDIEGVNTWAWSGADIAFGDPVNTNNSPDKNRITWGEKEESKHVASIIFKTHEIDAEKPDSPRPTTGKMEFTSLTITKYLLSAEKTSQTACLNDLTFYTYYNGGDAEQAKKFEDKDFVGGKNPLWNMNTAKDIIYGDVNNVEQQKAYVNLNDYEELRIYFSDAQENEGNTALRCWFIKPGGTFFTSATDETDAVKYTFDKDKNILEYPVVNKNDEGKNYATVDLTKIKKELGNAYLVGMKANSGNTVIVSDIQVYDANPISNYKISGRGEITSAVETILDAEDAVVIDATNVTKGGGTESVGPMLTPKNPNCLFIANEGVLANTDNVLVANGDGYDCDNLVLDVAQPIRIPGTIKATAASVKKNVTDAGYATMVLPFDVTVPENVTAYQLTAVEGEKVMGDALETIPAGQPVLLKADAEDYTFVATNGATLTAGQKPAGKGLLTGVYADGTAPANSYVLQNNEPGGVAFYKVENDNAQKVKQYTAYLTLPEAQQANRLVFALGEDDVTGVEGVEATAAAATVVEIYDLSGRRVSAPVKGINLIKMSDGTVKKVIVK